MTSQFNDSPDDVTLPTRRASQAAEGSRSAALEDARPAEREVTLNTGIVLALFFALALLCAVFFGFGYSIGHKSAPAAAIAAAAEPDTTLSADNPAPAKPAAGSAASTPVPEYVPPSGAERAVATAPSKPPANSTESTAVRKPEAPAASATVPARPTTTVTVPTVQSTPSSTVAATSGATGTSYVQVAAVSHQEDADVLLSSLRRRGYAVQARNEPNDKLIHVQLGPFGSRKEAEAMRQKLAGDGYNAFIK